MQRKRKRRAGRSFGNFYPIASNAAPEAAGPSPATSPGSLADELSRLWAKLADALDARPDDTGLLMRCADLFARAVAAADNRPSAGRDQELTESMRRVLDDLGPLILPAD